MRFSLLATGGLTMIAACGGGGGANSITNPPPGGGGGGGGGTVTLVHASRVTATTTLTFNPADISIPAGDTIYFTFQSGVVHNVKFNSAGNPGDIGDTSNATVKRVFGTVGTFNYQCSIHPGMSGSVTVTK